MYVCKLIYSVEYNIFNKCKSCNINEEFRTIDVDNRSWVFFNIYCLWEQIIIVKILSLLSIDSFSILVVLIILIVLVIVILTILSILSITGLQFPAKTSFSLSRRPTRTLTSTILITHLLKSLSLNYIRALPIKPVLILEFNCL